VVLGEAVNVEGIGTGNTGPASHSEFEVFDDSEEAPEVAAVHPIANQITGTAAPAVAPKQSTGPASPTGFEVFDDSLEDDTATVAPPAVSQTPATATLVPAAALKQSTGTASHFDFEVFDDSLEDLMAAPAAPANNNPATGNSTQLSPAEGSPGGGMESPPSFSLLEDLTTDFTGSIQTAL